jgi:3-oxoacyl-[acyl-carrier protein] reductase
MSKVAIITGATSLMAEETFKLLSEDNWEVYLCSRSYNMIDATNQSSIDYFVKAVFDNQGKIDAMINIAGGVFPPTLENRKLFLDTPVDEFNNTINCNFKSVVNTTRAVLPYMIKANTGSIISIISGAAFKGYVKMSAYSSAKAGVLAFTKTIAQEYAHHNIRANCILPGFTDNRWNLGPKPTNNKLSPLGRNTTPVDIANMIQFLVSEKATHITGSCFDISGGVALH